VVKWETDYANNCPEKCQLVSLKFPGEGGRGIEYKRGRGKERRRE